MEVATHLKVVAIRHREATRHKVAMEEAIRKDPHKVVIHRTAKVAASPTHKDHMDKIPMVSRPVAMHRSRDSFNHLHPLAMVPTMMPRVSPRTSLLTTRAFDEVSYARSTSS